jgi:hypothetical protein
MKYNVYSIPKHRIGPVRKVDTINCSNYIEACSVVEQSVSSGEYSKLTFCVAEKNNTEVKFDMRDAMRK